MIDKLLYLTYIPLETAPTSGSSVRPQKMKFALESLGIDVKTFGGINNNLALRKKTVSEIRALLKNWKPDACYIEPPSGPLFFYGDIGLIKHLHRLGIPISIFYRDAYWKYPEYSKEGKVSIKDHLKSFIIKQMQLHQWKVFRKSIDLIYFPSLTMAKEFDCPNKSSLPPGCFLADMKVKPELSNPLQFIFVGGAARNYGTFLTIKAFEKVNSVGIKAKVTYVCPKHQWDKLGINKEVYKEWLTVCHVTGDESLKPLYEQADVAILTAPRTYYRDFAVPIKIFEYMSYLKPMLVTDCTETARVVSDNQVGWIVNADVKNVAEEIEFLCRHPEEIEIVKRRMESARNNNLWSKRAEQVLMDLNLIRNSLIQETNKP